MRLTGAAAARDENGVAIRALDPLSDKWRRELLKCESLAQEDGRLSVNPLAFNIEVHRASLAEKLCVKYFEPGTESDNNVSLNSLMGIAGSGRYGKGGKEKFEKKIIDPKTLCSVCGITAGLKLCSGCQAVAFCCREHQVDDWPSHKAACKAARKGKAQSK